VNNQLSQIYRTDCVNKQLFINLSNLMEVPTK